MCVYGAFFVNSICVDIARVVEYNTRHNVLQAVFDSSPDSYVNTNANTNYEIAFQKALLWFGISARKICRLGMCMQMEKCR